MLTVLPLIQGIVHMDFRLLQDRSDPDLCDTDATEIFVPPVRTPTPPSHPF